MMFGWRGWQIIGVSFGALLAGNAVAQLYSADMASSEWKLASGAFACNLSHSIPGFGKAVFARRAGADVFYLESAGKVNFPVGTVSIETMPPPWRNDLVPSNLGSALSVAGNQSVSLNSAQVAPLVAQLSAGVNVMYSSQTSSTTPNPSVVRVVVNAKNFAANYKNYQQCLANIIPYGFEQVARTSISYGEKPAGLTQSNKADLTKVARYIKADPKVVGVFIDGHSDNSSTADANEGQSKQEAEWVAAYLVEQGVSAEKITTRWHGDKFLIANNKTAAGRAQNRRVTVRLEDEAAHKEFMKKEEEKRKADEKANAEKIVADNKKSEASSAMSSSSSSAGRMSPEEISRMVEGLDSSNKK